MSQCEHGHPVELIDDCLMCGAPQCCPWCCEVQSLEQKLVETRVDNLLTQKTLEAQVEILRDETLHRPCSVCAKLEAQVAELREAVKSAYIEGWSEGHNEGIGCGHALAPRCKHKASIEWLLSEASAALEGEL